MENTRKTQLSVSMISTLAVAFSYVFVVIEAEIGDLLHREHCVRVALVDDAVRHALLVDLSVVDLLLQTPVHHEPVHETRLLLTVSAILKTK